MIKKTIYSTIVLFLIYTAIVSVADSPDYSQSQWQNNVMRAEEYLYGPQRDTVIVGSSLAYRLPASSPFFNLAFAGMGVLDGLEIIRVSENYPKTVLIETNIIRTLNKSFLTGLTGRPVMLIRRAVPMTREKHNPVSMFLYGLKSLKKHLVKQSVNSTAAPAITDNPEHDRNLRLHLDEEQEALDSNQVTGFMEALKGYVKLLGEHGTTVIFIDLPVDRELQETVRYKQIKNSYRSNFNTDDYRHISADAEFKFKTTDGIHLNEASAKDYLDFIVEKTSTKGR